MMETLATAGAQRLAAADDVGERRGNRGRGEEIASATRDLAEMTQTFRTEAARLTETVSSFGPSHDGRSLAHPENAAIASPRSSVPS